MDAFPQVTVTVDPAGRRSFRAVAPVPGARRPVATVGGNLDETARLSRGTVYNSAGRPVRVDRAGFWIRVVLIVAAMVAVIVVGGRLFGVALAAWMGV